VPFLLLRFSVEALDGLTDDLPNFFVFILASLLRVVPFFRRGTLPDHHFGLAIDRIKRGLSLHGILHVWSETRGRPRADTPRITARRVPGKWMDIQLMARSCSCMRTLASNIRDFRADLVIPIFVRQLPMTPAVKLGSNKQLD